MAKIGYIRVSTEEQNTARQEEALNKLNLDRIFIEKISGKDRNREQLKVMLNYVREGDILYIESLSRLGRSTLDLINIVNELNEKHVQLISLKEFIDTSTPSGKLTFTIFAALAEFERETTRLRQREGIEIAKKQGKYKGRKTIEYNIKIFQEFYPLWKSGKLTAVDFMKRLNVKKTTFYKIINEYESIKIKEVM